MSNFQSPSGDAFSLLVQDRIKTFWGYGNLKSDIWLVGMEEGYGESVDETLIKRLRATANGSVFDIVEDMSFDPAHMKWFKIGAATQTTYRKFVFFLVYLRLGRAPNIEEIREYQIAKFGRRTSDHAILELMPLPSKSAKEATWLYGSFGIQGLSSRDEYLKIYMPRRVEALRELIHQHKPKLVIFYSLSYRKYWSLIMQKPLTQLISRKLSVAKDDSTIYAVVSHPGNRRYSNKDWLEVVEAIRKYLVSFRLV